MNKKNLSLLITLAAIWGASFLFMKILAPIYGPVLTATFRLLIGGLFLIIVFTFKKEKIYFKGNLKQLITIGILQSAFPFTLFSLAALYIPSTISVIINALTPMFVALFAFILLKEKLSFIKTIGLFLGVIGVSIVSLTTTVNLSSTFILGVAVCILGAASYGIASIYLKTKAQHIPATTIALGSQISGGLILLPLSIISPIISTPTLNSIIFLILFGVLCSGVAFYIFFYLQKAIGPLKTTSVTLIQPLFGVMWAVLILNEIITKNFIIGALIVLVGVYLVLKPDKKPQKV